VIPLTRAIPERNRGGYDNALHKSTFTYLLTNCQCYVQLKTQETNTYTGWPRTAAVRSQSREQQSAPFLVLHSTEHGHQRTRRSQHSQECKRTPTSATFLPLAANSRQHDCEKLNARKNRRYVCRAWLTSRGSRSGRGKVTQGKSRCC